MKHDHNWIADAAKALAGGAKTGSKPILVTPLPEIRQAEINADTTVPPPAALHSVEPEPARNPYLSRSTEPSLAGLDAGETQSGIASQTHSVEPDGGRKPNITRSTEPELAVQHSCDHQLASDSQPYSSGGQGAGETHTVLAPTGTEIRAGHQKVDTQIERADTDLICQQIVEDHRRKVDLLRARQRLELQAQAVCRRLCDGDKDKAGKLWGEVKKNAEHPLRAWLEPYMAGMAPLEAAKLEREKALAKLVKKLPIYAWAKTVPGLGEVSLAGIIGECGKFQPGEYRTVSALWKRMGLAVIEGQRQRKVTGAAALDHGYNAERRSLMWNIGCCIIKAQVRNAKDEAGKAIPGSSYGIGELGQLYITHKAALHERNEAGGFAEAAARAVERAKKTGSKPLDANVEGKLTKPHLHNMAQRYIEKRLLRQLWQAWRGGHGAPEHHFSGAPSPQPIQGGATRAAKTGTTAPLPETTEGAAA